MTDELRLNDEGEEKKPVEEGEGEEKKEEEEGE